MHTKAILDIEKVLEGAGRMGYLQDNVRKLTARLEAKEEELRKYKDFWLSLYESYHGGVLKKKDFISFQESYDVKIAEAGEAVERLKAEIEAGAYGASQSHGWVGKFREYARLQTLERKTVAELVEKVAVYEGGRIDVTFRYYNEFLRLRGAA